MENKTPASDEVMTDNAAQAAATEETLSEIKQPYAGFWKRAVAYLIDAILLTFVLVLLGFIFAMFGVIDFNAEGEMTRNGNFMDLLSILVSWAYFSLMESSSKQATFGKMAFGIQVTDYANQRISWVRATVRFFSKYLSAILLLIGFIMIAFTARKQGLHDFIASTLVVNKS
ncbi:RDD family protein [Hydrogenovibrio sp. 3SP14C1]|uniref:RDD family protein n=1 Tax=Hydrogenovibrio sp. 3SP14C1 TaxID=3038774 RepID=UPI0024169945|nr:RDD family protein [Hydrogenovibrio sp. 3SP14C1]MDG4812272.1 RDD family protein [Hydrogenovibrio sp. 3SP14C1]